MGWSFRSLDFSITAPDAVFEEWWETKTLHTVDMVLGGSLRYVDIGAADIQPMSFIMQWEGTNAVADRQTMQTYRGTTGTLEDDNGRSCTALLADAQPIRVKSPTSGYVRLSATFVYVSS